MGEGRKIVFENGIVGIALVQDGRIVEANQRLAAMFGYAPREMNGMAIRSLAAPDEECSEAVATLLPHEAGNDAPPAAPFRRRDGSLFWASCDLAAADPDAPSAGSLWVVLDVSGCKRAEAALQRCTARLAQSEALAHLGHWELDLIADRLFWSDEVFRIFELDPERFAASYEAFLALVHPADRMKVDKAYTDSLANKLPYSIEHRLLMPDGRIKFVLEQCLTDFDSLGKPLRSIGTVQDITERKKAEETRARLAAIVESSNDAIISRDLEGTILTWNAAAERLFGYTAAQAIGQPITIIVPEDGRADLEKNTRILCEGGRVPPTEVTRRTRDGALIEVLRSISPVRDESGTVVGAAIIVSDISELKRARRELQQQAQLARLLATLARTASEAETPEAAMQACVARICEYGDWALGRFGSFTGDGPEKTLRSSLWHSLHPERFSHFLAIADDFHHSAGRGIFVDAALREGKPVWIADFAATPGVGRLAHAGRYGIRAGFVFPIFVGNEPQAFLEFFATEPRPPDAAFLEALDPIASQLARIIERERAAAQLRLAASVFDTAAEGIMITDSANKILSVNRAFTEITGYCAAEVIGKNPRLLQSGLQPEAFYREMWAAIGETGRWQGEIWDRRKNGELYCELLSISTVRDATGRTINHCAILMDITARKAAEAELRRLNADLESRVAARTAELARINRELEAFSYSVSHDLRAPLRTIRGFAKIVLEENAARLGAEAVGHLKRIVAGGERMEMLIDDLLTLARVSRQVISRQEVDLSEMARQVTDALVEAQPQRRARIAVQPGLKASADPGLSRIALENLIGNAWKFTAGTAETQIEFGTAAGAGETVYFVRDNGTGFNPKYAHKLFAPFERLHNSRDFEGTGIGLSIVERIVTRHGGRVWAESEPGHGATFYFTLGPQGSRAAPAAGDDATPAAG
ncbi:MAG: PAS domain S-box protein [Burkholderiales bacterium]